ncbi:MAG TPA: acyl-CoA carboxylase epsilon subunit [Ornithinimicrobium sp.]|nr:acyl-CoA carboxylase epsilon subunit [Ornithinimicrobium sp.]
MSGGTAAADGPGADPELVAEAPVIRVERGNPTPEQLAALTVVLAAAGGPDEPGSTGRRRTLWTARTRFARPRPAVGPDGWRASALPR